MTLAIKAGKQIKKSRKLGFEFDFKIKNKKSIRTNSRRGSRTSVYGSQLNMKQIIRLYYGVSEKKMKSYYQEASRRSEPTGITMIHLLESRLDNVVYRMGFAATRAQARQMVSHGHILINGKKVDIRSYLVSIGDKVEVKKSAQSHDRVNSSIEMAKEDFNCDWVKVDFDNYSGELSAMPDLGSLPEEFSKISLVVEWYSK